MTPPNLATIVNSTDDSTLAELVGRLKRAVKSCPHPHYFFPIYIAARGELYSAITDYLAEEIGIPAESRMDLLIPPREVDYQTILPRLEGQLNACQSDVVMLRVKGFQYVDKLQYGVPGVSRTAHDFDQSLWETGALQDNWKVQKKLILAVHLDPDWDHYREALQSAALSGFQMGLWRFDQTP